MAVRQYPLERTRKYRNYGTYRCRKKQQQQKEYYFIQEKHIKIGEVHEGEATMDWMAQEQERGYHNNFSCYNMFLEKQ